jgi:hypothetical protein
MKTKIIIAFVLLSVSSFWLGSYVSTAWINQSINELQAELAFSHLETYEAIKSDLDKKCEEQSLIRLHHAIDEQKMLMAEYVKDYDDLEFAKYISLRYPSLIDELKDYDVNWNKKWSVPNCDKYLDQ